MSALGSLNSIETSLSNTFYRLQLFCTLSSDCADVEMYTQ